MPSDRILRAVEAQPWALHPPKLEQILGVLEAKKNTGQIPEAADIEAAERRQRGRTQTSGAVAVLPVHGTLSQRMGMLDAMSGGSSLETIGAAFDELMAADDVETIILEIDSPGGSVYGVQELAEKIFAARGRKRVVAVANSLAASAAYWIGAAAEEFVVTPSGEVGSVGVYMVHFDMSEAMGEAGVKATVIRAGANKAESLPYSALSEETATHLQQQVDDYGLAFVEAVARYRGLSADAVLEDFGQGRTYTAKRALARGMVDRIATFEDVVFSAASNQARTPRRAFAHRAQRPAASWAVSEGSTTDFTAALDTIERMAARFTHLTAQHTDTPAPAVGQAAPVESHAPIDMAPEAREDTMSAQDTAAQPGAVDTSASDAIKAETGRIRQINALASEHGVDQTQVSAWISQGTSLSDVRASILEQVRQKAAQADTVRVTGVKARHEDDPRRGFRSHREFLMSVMDNQGFRARDQVGDERLRSLAVFDSKDREAGNELAFMLPTAFTPHGIRAAAGSDEHGTYADPYGGFAVPETTLPGLLTLDPEADPTAGRTQPLPMATPTVKINARVDKDHSDSVSGGLTVSRRAETETLSSSRMQVEQVQLSASSLFGLAFETEELMTDSPISFAALIASGFQDQFDHHMIGEKIRGLGGSEYLGVLNSDCLVTITDEAAQAADTIVAENVIKMRSRCWGYQNAIWIANHDAYPQLATMAVEIGSAAGVVQIYSPSLREDRPDMLLGRPIFYSEYASTVGDAGDIILGNWSQYLDGLYQPLQSAESMHVRFLNHERAFKFWLRNAGAPWWKSALTPNQSTDTLSPFVVIETRTG